MRNPLVRLFTTLLICAAFALIVLTPATFAKRHKARAKTISGSGCVTAGVEAGCLMLTDKKTQKVYNLYFRGKKPKVGTAIQFRGTRHDGVTMCMQGEAVNVRTWVSLKMRCVKKVDYQRP